MSQERVAPSAKLAKAVEELVARVDDEADGWALLGQLAQLGARKLVQEALEAEQAEHPVATSGGEWSRPPCIATATNRVERPQVRGGSEPYRSRIWDLVGGRSERVERLVVEMYSRGLS